VTLDYGTSGWSNAVVTRVGNQIVLSHLTTPALPAFETWQTSWFGTAADAKAAFDVDADGDGIVNLLEYAFGTTPTNPSSRNVPTCGTISNHLSITFTRATNATDLIYTVEESTNLLTWLPVTNLTATAPPLGPVTVQGTIDMGTHSSREYLRVKVTRP
jgi:hypothetical protein